MIKRVGRYLQTSEQRQAKDFSLDHLVRRIDELSLEVRRLADEVQWLKAEKIAARIDAGEETLIPLELAIRVFDAGEHPLKVLREWRGLSQEELAKKAGTTKGYISQIETRHRKPGRRLLFRLARVLEVPPHMLLEEEKEGEDEEKTGLAGFHYFSAADE